MRKEEHISRFAVLLFISAFLSGCVQFKEATLYDGVEPLPKIEKPASINAVVEPVIYADNASDMWGLEKTVCKDASLTSKETYSGNEAIAVSWNRNEPGCEFAGIGIGWDGYAGKNLVPLMDYAAIEMRVKAKGERMFGLPIVLTLEDYSGGMGFAYTDNRYFERTTIDDEWQRVTVPLKDFDLETEGLNPGNIKQLQLELQQSGDVYIDDIRLIFYDPEPVEPWMEEETLPDPLRTPLTIFDDEFINNNSWGFISDACQEFSISEETSFSGERAIHARWTDADNCELTMFGASWNKWHPIDMKKKLKTRAFQFQLKLEGGKAEQIEMGMEDYDRAYTFVKIKSEFLANASSGNDWAKVTIPLSAFPDDANFEKIKQMAFRFSGTGEALIDEIKLIEVSAGD